MEHKNETTLPKMCFDGGRGAGTGDWWFRDSSRIFISKMVNFTKNRNCYENRIFYENLDDLNFLWWGGLRQWGEWGL